MPDLNKWNKTKIKAFTRDHYKEQLHCLQIASLINITKAYYLLFKSNSIVIKIYKNDEVIKLPLMGKHKNFLSSSYSPVYDSKDP